MKFTLSWLKDHLETKATLAQICDTLTMIGLEVESVADRAAELKSFTVAKILRADKHPQADKLQICRVQSDIGELQIVCGAANARAGLHVALAKEGAVIPHGGMVIKKTKIRGVESNGMLCSAAELDLGIDSEGIIELPETSKIGESIVTVLGLDDPVIEIAITPNRADALGVHGIARDLAAAGLGTLKPLPDVSGIKGAYPSPIQVTIADTAKCLQFIGCTIKGVKNGESSDWLKKRLVAIGQKSISALVDITNYITIDLGRPLHVYDAKKLHGNITVRDAKPGDQLKALNGTDYGLNNTELTVIADERGPVAIAGVIGGEETGCQMDTADVFLEVALFNPTDIAKAGRSLGIESDARYRFERGVDPDFVETGALLAIRLIKQLCGGEVSELTLAGKTPEWQRNFALRQDCIASLGGITIPSAKAEDILKALGFTCETADGNWEVSPPSWRADIDGEAALIEEILRIHGYNQIPSTKLPPTTKPFAGASQKRASLASRILAQRGMTELCTWSFLPEAQAKMFGGTNPKLKLLNPISAELDTMRPSLLPNLLEAAKKNAFRGFKDLSLFEVGLQFHDVTPDGQRMIVAGLRAGQIVEHRHKDTTFQCKERVVDVFDAKADALVVLRTLGLNKYDITSDTPPWYHPGRSGALLLGKTILGYFGEVHPGILPTFDMEGSIAAFEIFLDAIPAARAKGKAKPSLKLSDFQVVERDFAFTVAETVSAAEIIKSLSQADKQLITGVEIFDVYTGNGVESGKKSVAVKIMLQSFERTLSEQDIAAVSNAIIDAAKKDFGGQLRQ